MQLHYSINLLIILCSRLFPHTPSFSFIMLFFARVSHLTSSTFPSSSGYSSLSISQAILQSHIGSIYEAAQDYQTAQLFFIQTLTTVRDVYGVNVHPRVLCAILNLGGVLLAQRVYSAALELFLEAEEMMGKLAGQDEWGIDGGTLRRCIAICYCGLMRFG